MINLTWRKPIATSGRFKWMLHKAYAYGGDAYVRNGSPTAVGAAVLERRLCGGKLTSDAVPPAAGRCHCAALDPARQRV
jgi:hypothetical protein